MLQRQNNSTDRHRSHHSHHVECRSDVAWSSLTPTDQALSDYLSLAHKCTHRLITHLTVTRHYTCLTNVHTGLSHIS